MGALAATTHIALVVSILCIHESMGSPVGSIFRNGKDDSTYTGYESSNVDCGHWRYPSTDWAYTCPNACNGKNQSPINIYGDSAKDGTGAFTFSSSYSDPINKIKIENNGYTATASWDSSLPSRTISGGGLTGDYTLLEFHTHWGCRNNRGSEHTVNGTRYSMELHLVHYKTAYGNVTEALKYEDGLAVLGVFFDVDAENAALKPITDSAPAYGNVTEALKYEDDLAVLEAFFDVDAENAALKFITDSAPAYGKVTEALKYEDGLAVLGVFFDVDAENAALKPITDNLSKVVHSGTEVEIDFNVALLNLIPTTQTFYRYKGSLTTPTCNEIVIWSVFSTPQSFSEDQVKAFRMLKDKEGHHLCDNYRGIQPLHGREVKVYSA